MVREGNEIGHHAQNAVREELLVSGHSRHHLWLQCGHVHEDLQTSNWIMLAHFLLLKGREQNKAVSDGFLPSSELKKISTVQLYNVYQKLICRSEKPPSVTYSSSSTQASALLTNISETRVWCQVSLSHGNMQTPPVPESQSIHSFHRTGFWQAAPSGKGWWKWTAQDTGWVFLSLGSGPLLPVQEISSLGWSVGAKK